MKHEEFLEKYLRTPQDYDKSYGVQCIDLARLYSEMVLGIKLGVFGGTAKAGWYNKSKTFDLNLWTRVPNSPKAIPPRGAIIFYSSPSVTGHVGVVDSADINDVLLLEQNGATGNGDGKGYNAISFNVKRDYTDCLGWYVKK